jgi:hypothetical protein
MPITEQGLLDAGYKKHPPGTFFSRADHLFQKRFDGPDGSRLYFIDIFQFIFPDRIGWQPEVQLHLEEDHARTFNLTVMGFDSIEEIEQFIERVYRTLECAPHERASG